ncbi:MAG: hypothetical protein LBR18_07720 [Tannerella sp.]|jgi:V/A-type H+-transporting ATPase subunit E|nr:hypothetical protein [Tannerella sp.]
MDAKIQEITDKIYREGVEKGKSEAEKIISDAKEKEAAIIAAAETKAQEIAAAAAKQADDLRANTEAELRLFASQALEALKSEATNIITGKIAGDNVHAATADAGFMQKIMLEIARGWANNEDVTIQTADAAALTDYFAANAKDLLDRGVRIEQVNGKKTSFTLAPADGSYKLTFGDDEFISFFKDFLRPQLFEMLFR